MSNVVQVQLVESIAETEAMSAFFMQVWADGPEVVPFDLSLAVQHVGGYSAVAKLSGQIVGASFGFLGDLGGQKILHSHVTAATVPGVGFEIKQHQKQWAAERGIDAITWTFDPLVRRNAVFNFEKLGAIGIEYLPNFYGTMVDAINAGDDSDRLFVRWPLNNAEVYLGKQNDDSAQHEVEAIVVELPEDIETLRKTDIAAARDWRKQVRKQLQPALADGYQVTGMLNRTSLVLERP